MTIFFPDVSRYQGSLKIQPNTVALVAKATEGTNFLDANYAEFKAQAKGVGSEFCAYHFLWSGSPAEAAWAFKNVGSDTPLMIDAENTKVKTGVPQILEFAKNYRALGGIVHVAYLPHWYWQGTLNSPDLNSLTDHGILLSSSSYVKYSDNGIGWDAYGGVTPSLWQYTDKLPYGGETVDFNAFKGTVQQLHNIWHYGTLTAPAPGPVPDPKPPVPRPHPPLPKYPNIAAAIKLLERVSRNRPGPVGHQVREALKILRGIK